MKRLPQLLDDPTARRMLRDVDVEDSFLKSDFFRVPDTFQLGAILSYTAFLAGPKINRCVFSIPLNIPTPPASTILSSSRCAFLRCKDLLYVILSA